MSAEKGLALLEGTKVRMTCDHGTFNKGDIVTRRYKQYNDSDGVAFESDKDWHYLTDDEWEFIEDKEEIKERLPTQGDKVQVKNEGWSDWSGAIKTFVCFYRGKVIAEDPDSGIELWGQWRFPFQEEVTLSDGNTYLVEERGEEKFLILKK